MVKIIQNGHPTLRKVAKPVPIKEITGEKIQKILKDMQQALAKEYDGYYCCATNRCVFKNFVVSKKVSDEQLIKDENILIENKNKDAVFINPKF